MLIETNVHEHGGVFMNKKAGAVLAIDIGGSKLVTGVVDADGSIYGESRAVLSYPLTKEDLRKLISELCHKTLAQYGKDDVLCAGATIPGLADPEKGLWVYASFSGIGDFPIAEQLETDLGIPVYIENDVNACALGEIYFGSCKEVSDFLWITVSNGVGGSVVINGHVHSGAYGNAGEFGHVNVKEDGYLCQCGNRGCTEAQAAGPAILRRYLDRSGSADESLSAKQLALLAREGDLLAQEIFTETGYFLAKAIAPAVNVLNPQKVIIGGGVALSFDLFYPELKKTLDRMVFQAANQNLVIEQTALGYAAALYGAAAVGFQGINEKLNGV